MTQTIDHPSACACCVDMLRARFDRRRFLQISGTAGMLAALPSFATAAEGKYEAMLLTCIDPRFPQPTINYMKHRRMIGKYSQFTFAGASIGVVAPAFKNWSPAFWENLAASMQLHKIPKVIAMNHRDCGAAKIAYGADAVKDHATETATHKAALMEFKKQVAEKQPSLKVELGLMAVNGKVEMFS
jgi:carbonic anhydrase